jgi:FixJ family two-component response regulator
MCDLRMPGMSGQGVHAALVADFPALVDRVVFVTGDVVEPMTAAFLRAAGRPVVEKPFTMTELASAVAKVLEAS